MYSGTKGKAKVGKLIVEELNIAIVVMDSDHVDRTLNTEELKCNILRLTGTADAGFNVIFNASITNFYVVHNVTGQTATLKNAAGSSTTIADGDTHLIFNDGTNIVKIV